MDSFVHEHVFFLSVNRLVRIIQRNKTLDALIKYVAYYHILYSGQLEILLSVYVTITLNVQSVLLVSVLITIDQCPGYKRS